MKPLVLGLRKTEVHRQQACCETSRLFGLRKTESIVNKLAVKLLISGLRTTEVHRYEFAMKPLVLGLRTTEVHRQQACCEASRHFGLA